VEEMPPSRSIGQKLSEIFSQIRPGFAFILMILGALIAFEIFNYSTTDHALQDLLGNLEFGDMRWSTILALAFCGIDFAGIARLFTPEQGADEPKEVWYLFGAWLIAATMNAILTWWGVSMAIVNHPVQSSVIIEPKTITTVVPVFIAVMVWVIRILIIGTLSIAMDRYIHVGDRKSYRRPVYNNSQTVAPVARPMPASQPNLAPRPTLNRGASMPDPRFARSSNDISSRNVQSESISRGVPEPTYHSLNAANRNSPPVSQGDRPTNNNIRR
jgi:hypothetical protein